jgi:hypothetical protein
MKNEESERIDLIFVQTIGNSIRSNSCFQEDILKRDSIGDKVPCFIFI